MRCFVAMAFGRDETDETYRKLIAPALRRVKVTPVRVDRIEHLEDINTKIISELNKCDLALADLTYARPSVYFEAGYAQRAVPVVYTCRKDHLSGRADDQFGNFRVHFDLRMKNIIPWSSAKDKNFSSNLERRVRRAVLPILHTKKVEDIWDSNTKRFAALSLQEKIRIVEAISRSVLSVAGYKPPKLIFYRRHRQSYRVEAITRRMRSLSPGFVVTKQTNATIRAMLLHVTSSLTQSELQFLDSNLLSQPVYNLTPIGKPGLLVEHLVVCSLTSVPISRIQTSLSRFHFDRDSNEFVWHSALNLPEKRIRGYDELYKTGQPYSFLGLSSHHAEEFHEDYPWLVSEQEERREWRLGKETTRHKRMVHLASVKRHLHLRIFDDIKFEKQFRDELQEWLKEAQKCN